MGMIPGKYEKFCNLCLYQLHTWQEGNFKGLDKHKTKIPCWAQCAKTINSIEDSEDLKQ